MKAKFYTIILIAIYTCTAASGQNINWLTGDNPGPYGLNKSEKVVGATDVWVSGDRGYLLKTSDNGANWTAYPTGSTSDIVDIAAQGRRNLYAVGADGKAYFTQDFGESWSDVVIKSGNFESPVKFTGIEYVYQSFSQPGHFIAVAQGASKGLILKSTGDGSCSNCTQELSVIAELSDVPNDIFFHSYYDNNLQEVVNRAYIVGTNGLTIYSEDYFDSSTPISTHNATESLSSIVFSTDFPELGFIGASGAIYGTKDGGASWTKQSAVPWSVSTVTDIAFRPGSNTAYATAIASTSITTSFYSELTQSGNGFNSPVSYIDENDLFRNNETYNSIYLFNNNLFSIFSGNGVIVRSTDGATSWSPQNTVLADPQAIEVAGGEIFVSYGASTSIRSTLDNGNNWNDIQEFFTTDPENQIDIIKLLDVNGTINGMAATALEGNFYEVANNNSVFSGPIWSPNGTIKDIDVNPWGVNWFVGNSAVFLAQSDFFDANEISMVGTGFVVGTNTDAYGIDFIDENTGFVVGPDGFILKTTNKGVNWSTLTSGVNDDLMDVGFFDSNKGVVLIDKSTNNYLHTINGGDNWTVKSLPGTSHWQEIIIVDETTAYAYGQDGLLITTSDAGATWSNVETGYTGNIIDMSYEDATLYGLVEGGFVFTSTAKQDQTISFDEIADKTFGDEPFSLSASSSSELVVVLEASGPISLNGTTVTITGAGQATITASQGGNEQFNAAESVERSFTIAKATDAITFPTLEDASWNATTIDLTTTASSISKRTISWSSSDETVVTIGETSGLLDYKAPGIATITASISEHDNWLAAPAIERSLTVTKASQTIDFEEIPDKAASDEPFNLAATASSGFAVQFEVLNGPAQLQGAELTLTGVGEVTIRASQTGNDFYFAANPVDRTFTVGKQSQTITFASIDDKTFGDDPFNVNPTSSSQLPVTITIVSGSVSLSENQVTITGAGEVTLAANQSGNEDFEAAEEVRRTFTINKANQSITFSPLAEATFGDVPFALQATGGASQKPVTFQSSNSSIASIDGNTVTIVTAGEVQITASQEGNDNYESAEDVIRTLTINKAAQTITFDQITDKTFGDEPFDLIASSDSDLQVSFEVTDGPASLSGNELTLTGAGQVSIQATQPGNINFNAATPVTRSFAVAKADQIISVAPIQDKRTNDEPFDIIASTDSELELTYEVTGPADNNGSLITLTGEPGTVTVTVSQSGNQNYNPAEAQEVSFEVIAPLPQTIAFDALPDKTFGDAPFALSATASSQLPVVFSFESGPANLAENVLTITGAGEVTIAANQSGNATYDAAPEVRQSFMIAKATQAVIFQPLAVLTFGDDPIALEATGGGSQNPITYTSSDENVASVNANVLTIVGAGQADITASQLGNENYEAAESITQGLTINKADQVITLEQIADKDISESPITISATTDSDLPLTIEVVGPAALNGNALTLQDIGEVTVTVSQVGNANFNAAESKSTSFTVSDASRSNQTITFPDISEKTFGQGTFDLNATASSNLDVVYTVISGPITISGSTVTITGAGNAEIAANQPGNGNFNPASEVSRAFTINKAAQMITFSNLEDRTFGDDEFELSATTSAGLTVSFSVLSGPASISGNTVELTGAGTVEIAADQAGNDNYNAATQATRSFEVAKADQVVTIESITEKTTLNDPFDLVASVDTDLPLTYTLTGPATIDGEIITLTGTAGEVTVTATQVGDDNYNTASANTTFTVVQGLLPQTISFSEIEDQVYGATISLDASAESNLEIVYELLTNNLVLEGTTLMFSGVGYAAIKAVQAGNNEYLPAEMIREFNIARAPLSLKASDMSRAYGEPNPEFTLSAEGLVYGEMITDALDNQPALSSPASEISIPGTYVISLTGASATNYQLDTENGELNIVKADLTVTANDAERSVGEATPTFSLSYDGFVNDQDETSLSSTPVVRSEATSSSGIGQYTITPEGGTSPLYDFNYIAGTLTITGATLDGIVSSTTPIGAGTAVLYQQNTDGSFTVAAESTVNSDGTFSFDNVDAGDHTMSIIPSGSDQLTYFTTYLTSATLINEANTFDLTQDAPVISITMASKPTTQGNGGDKTINGKLTDDPSATSGRLSQTSTFEGDPIANTEIWLVDTAGTVVGTDITDDQGNYSFTSLAAGSYTIQLNYEGQLLDFSGAEIVLEEGQSTVNLSTAINAEGEVLLAPAILTSIDKIPQIDWSVFPNPSREIINITIDDPGNWGLYLHNINGQLVLNTSLKQYTSLPITHLPRGIYLLKLMETTKRQELIKRIILE